MSAGLFCVNGLYADAILQIVLHMAGIVGILILVIKKVVVHKLYNWLVKGFKEHRAIRVTCVTIAYYIHRFNNPIYGALQVWHRLYVCSFL